MRIRVFSSATGWLNGFMFLLPVVALMAGCGDDNGQEHDLDGGQDPEGGTRIDFVDERGHIDDFPADIGDDGEANGAPEEGMPAAGGTGGGSAAAGHSGAADAGVASDMGDMDPQQPQQWTQTSDDVSFASVDVGGGETLELKRMRVTAKVEGLRARTLVDHIYYNPHDRALEGTFRYPLPTEASISYYAMFVGADAPEDPDFFGSGGELDSLSKAELAALDPEVIVDKADHDIWGELRVGRIVKPERAREVFEEITRRNIDPALVEQVAPNSFQARVFPIPAHGYNRVLVAYEQTLPAIGEELVYEFTAPEGDIESFAFTANARGDADMPVSILGDIQDLARSDGDGTCSFDIEFRGDSPGGSVMLGFARDEDTPHVDVLSGTDPTRDEDYFVARIRPSEDLFGETGGARAQAIFVLDTSLSQSPDRFGVDIQLMRAILENNDDIEQFAVLTFDTGARWLDTDWTANTAEQRDAVIERMTEVLLEGSTDFSAALDALASPPFAVSAEQGADIFVLSDGVINRGVTHDVTRLVAEHEAERPYPARFFVYRTGLQAENLELFGALTRHGAIFNCLTAQSVAPCSTAHTAAGIVLEQVVVETADGEPSIAEEVVVAGRQATLFPGAQLVIAGRLLSSGDAQIRLQGRAGDNPVALTFPVALVPDGELAPRAWAEIVTSQLLQTHDPELEDVAVALSQHYRIVNRVASLLVLETDEEYEQYDLDQEKERLPEDLLVTVIENAYRDLGSGRTDWQRLRETLLAYDSINRITSIDGGDLLDNIADAVEQQQLELPPSSLDVPLLMEADVSADYLNAMSREPNNIAPFQAEAERRHGAGELGAAVRALTCVVENNPSDPEASRMTAYRLASWGETEAAAALFFDVLRSRPYEPVSYRDLAGVLRNTRPALSAVLYEAVLAGDWDARFGELKTVVREEYAMLIRGLQQTDPDSALAGYLDERRSALDLVAPTADLRVTITWNTDNTDIDLWVTDPQGERCYYANPEVSTGGQLLDDLTQGFGPERFEDQTYDPGEYVVQVHYYGNNGNLLSAATHVNVIIMVHAGTDREQVQYHNVVLEEVDEVVTVATVTF